MAEDTGLIIALGEWVMHCALEQLARWRDAGLPEFRLAMNVAPAQLMAPGFTDTLAALLLQHELSPRRIDIEINESALVMARERGSDVMDRLKAMGVSISIDDFGTGISTLSYLKDYPVDLLKLDPALIRNLPRDNEDKAIVSAIIKLARDLQIKVVAEGVETFDQLNYLRTTSCHFVQGFLFSEAVRPDKFEQVLLNRSHKGQIFH